MLEFFIIHIITPIFSIKKCHDQNCLIVLSHFLKLIFYGITQNHHFLEREKKPHLKNERFYPKDSQMSEKRTKMKKNIFFFICKRQMRQWYHNKQKNGIKTIFFLQSTSFCIIQSCSFSKLTVLLEIICNGFMCVIQVYFQ